MSKIKRPCVLSADREPCTLLHRALPPFFPNLPLVVFTSLSCVLYFLCHCRQNPLSTTFEKVLTHFPLNPHSMSSKVTKFQPSPSSRSLQILLSSNSKYTGMHFRLSDSAMSPLGTKASLNCSLVRSR